jgi:hypothetical protein
LGGGHSSLRREDLVETRRLLEDGTTLQFTLVPLPDNDHKDTHS